MPRQQSKVLALILAGGAGGRLEVLTEERAKPAVPFAGTYRLIDFSLSNCVHSRIADVWVVEQYEPHSLNDHLANGRPWDLDRTYGGLQVLPPYVGRAGEESAADGGGFARGNADALYRNRRFIQEFDPDLLLILSADHVYKLDYNFALAAHAEREADVTMVTTRVPLAEAGRFGTVKVNRQNRVTDFAYKPERPESDIVTTEVFVYDARRLLKTLEELAGEKRGGKENASLQDYGHELLPRLVKEGRAYHYPLEGYWRDLGTIESYWQGHMDLLARNSALALDDPGWPILTYGTQRMPARVAASAQIENSLISPGCVIHGSVAGSVLAPGVVVERGAVVRDSVLLHDVIVKARARIERSIVDERVTIGAGARIGEAAAKRLSEVGKDQLAVIGMKAQIKSRARLAAGARVKPAARVK